MARKTQQRSLRQPEITIIGEGATERFYFTNLRRLKGYRYTCKPRNFTEQSLDEIQKQVDRVLADRGIAVCVFDTDITRNNPTERAKFEALCQKYKDRKDVIICDSMPSIEFWFLLHYLNTNRYFATANDVIDVLHKYIPDFSKQEKFLSKEKWVADLLADYRLETAIQRAQAFGTEGESYSNLPKAFEVIEDK